MNLPAKMTLKVSSQLLCFFKVSFDVKAFVIRLPHISSFFKIQNISLDDIFTIDNPELLILIIYPTELQLNRAKTSDKDTSRVKCEANFDLSGSKIDKRLQRRMYDPGIIENTTGLVPGSSTAFYRSFLKHCTLTKNAMGTIRRDLSKPPQRRQGPDPRPL